jgi:hypothetical protein
MKKLTSVDQVNGFGLDLAYTMTIIGYAQPKPLNLKTLTAKLDWLRANPKIMAQFIGWANNKVVAELAKDMGCARGAYTVLYLKDGAIINQTGGI